MKNTMIRFRKHAGGMVAACAMLISFPASAAELNFPIKNYNFSYHAGGNVYLQLANGDWSKRAQVVFTRGEVPTDPIHYDETYGLVSATYSIDEFRNIQALLENSSLVFFNYSSNGVNEQAYLYSNP